MLLLGLQTVASGSPRVNAAAQAPGSGDFTITIGDRDDQHFRFSLAFLGGGRSNYSPDASFKSPVDSS